MIHLKHEPPEPQAYCDLRKVAGMSTKSLAAARKGLPNALFTVALYSEQQLIGLGRYRCSPYVSRTRIWQAGYA